MTESTSNGTMAPVCTSTLMTEQVKCSSDGVSITYLGVIGVLIVSLLATVAGWIVTCVVVWRKGLSKQLK